MGIAKALFTLDGENVSPPENTADFTVKISYGVDNQAIVTADNVTLAFDAYEKAMAWIKGGLSGKPGIFEGMPCELILDDGNDSVTGFSGCLDLRDVTVYPEINKLEAKLVKEDDLAKFNERLESVDCALLLEERFISAADYVQVPCVVERPGNGLDFIMLQVTTYLLATEVIRQTKDVSKGISGIVAEASGGFTGPIGATILSVAEVVLQLTFIGLMLKEILNLVGNMFKILIPPHRIHAGVKLKRLIEATAKKLGYRLETSIPELEYLVYLPSNTTADVQGRNGEVKQPGTIRKGIPNASDYGFVCSELFTLVKGLFNGRFKIEQNTLQFHNVYSSYWERAPKWKMPDLLKDQANKSYGFNTGDILASKLLTFATDVSDEYTITNYEGTTSQRLTKPKAVKNERCVALSGYDRIDFNVCLGNRKDSLNPFEEVLKAFAGVADGVARVFGGSGGFASKVQSRVGSLRVSSNNFTLPKLLWTSGGQLPANHRSMFNAEKLMKDYYNEKPDQVQKKIYNEVEVPFGMTDFLALQRNPYFTTSNGETGKLLSVGWSFGKHSAVISYEIPEIYTRNLKEEIIKP